jgi:hypothetical protein
MLRRSVGSWWLAVALLLLGGLSGCRSTGAGQTGALAGTVVDDATAKPVMGAEVAVGLGTAQTDAAGHFELAAVEVGTRSVSVSASGYEPLTQTVTIKSGPNSVALRLHRWGTSDGGASDGGAHDGGASDGGAHDGATDGPVQHDAGPQDGPCGTGTLYCGGGCATCPTGSISTSCSGSSCNATACGTGYRLCGTSCCAWAIEQVGWISSGSAEASLALDPSGHARIAYSDYTTTGIYYADRSSGQFYVETIGAEQTSNIGIAVDSYGNPHVAYTRASDAALTYASRSSGWTRTPIFTLGLYPSIAVDGTNAVHIAFMGYTATTPVALKRAYLAYSGASWRFDSVDDRGSSAAVGYNVSLAVTSSGLAHILYWASVSSINSLYYAYESGGYFYPSLVDSVDFVMGQRGAITVDSSGYPYVAYPAYLGSQNTVVRAGYRSGSWFIAQADPSTSVQGSASITLDPAHTAHGVYGRANGSTTEVVYATQVGTSWRAEVVGAGEVGSNHALAIDSSGNPHLVFVSPYSDSTRYVWYAH